MGNFSIASKSRARVGTLASTFGLAVLVKNFESVLAATFYANFFSNLGGSSGATADSIASAFEFHYLRKLSLASLACQS